MKAIFLLALVFPAAGQTPVVRLTNLDRPTSTNFQMGDRFEIEIIAPPNQLVSVRTSFNGRTDWGPVIGWTDLGGRWSTKGQIDTIHLGSWSEVWTVGGKLADPQIQFSVRPPCLPGGRDMVTMMSLFMSETCDTAEGSRTFKTISDTEPFQTPDGRLVPAPKTNRTPDEYHADVLASLMLGPVRGWKSGLAGDKTGAAIQKIIGPNALSDDEMRNVLAWVRSAFEKSGSAGSTDTVRLLENLAASTVAGDLKQQIADTIVYVQSKFDH